MYKLVLIIAIMFMIGCTRCVSDEHILFDFESDSELNQFHWKCHTLLSLTDEYVTHGKRSLKLELFPSDYPGIAPVLKSNNWGDYEMLCFDIYNPGNGKIPVTVRIDDRKDFPDYNDRYNRGFIIEPGMNRIRIPLETLVTSGTKRKIRLSKIYRFMIFMRHPDEKVVLYLDYIRLVS